MSDEDQLQQEIINSVGEFLLPENTNAIFKEKLAAYINDVIDHDFEKLIQLLYRLDVHEQKLKKIIASSPASDAGLLIADMIIERQLQKIQSRKQFKQEGNNIPENEKW